MKTNRITWLLLACVVVAGLSAPAASAKAKKKKKTGPVVVGTDESGDWGENGPTADRSLAPLGNALAQDLVEASITMADAATVNFVIKVSSLPPTGGVPEITRYVWDMTVDGEHLELDGKFTNYTRGTCDPTAGTCPPPRNPGQAPFLVRGNCTVTGAVTTCEELGLVNATFAQADGTITVPVPLEMLGGKPGSKIVPGATIFGGVVTAIPSVYLSLNPYFPMDNLNGTGIFTVPKK